MKKNLLLILLLITSFSYAQLSGTLKNNAGQELKLLGYNGFRTIKLGSTNIDSTGKFTLNYDTTYKGMGYLETSDKSLLFIVLNKEQITINGTSLNIPDSIVFTNSKENKLFTQYSVEHNQREKALAGWKYLLPQYKNVALLNKQKKLLNTIQKEITRLENQDANFLNKLDKTTYVSWFLPLRKLLDDMPLSAQRYVERIPKHIADFRQIDFNDKRLYHSGILDDLIDGHYWLLENSGLTFDSMYTQMNISTDYLMANLQENDTLLNAVINHLFDFLEKRSLFKASEYLALKALIQNSCTLNDDLAKQLETYRAMKVGNIATDINFEGLKVIHGLKIKPALKLSTMNNKYSLIVFGASWCPKCKEEIPKLAKNYFKWKQKGVEVVFISLDTKQEEFIKFTKEFPWLSVCDFKGWETQAAKDYYVFSSPTMFLLDKDRKILVRPSSIEQVDTWVKYKINDESEK